MFLSFITVTSSHPFHLTFLHNARLTGHSNFSTFPIRLFTRFNADQASLCVETKADPQTVVETQNGAQELANSPFSWSPAAAPKNPKAQMLRMAHMNWPIVPFHDPRLPPRSEAYKPKAITHPPHVTKIRSANQP